MFVVGIDLGTTHTVVACAELSGAAPRIETFHVAQLVAPGEVGREAMLPSVRYHPAHGELAAADVVLPWGPPDAIVGRLALDLGARAPGRFVASAKSWLSHGAVDRTAPILPWGAPAEVPKISPVDASASYLTHVRAAWDDAHPDHPLEAQDVVLTVPASFDEGARALTLAAAERAGLAKLRLVEEPQAAFYDWLDAHEGDLEAALGGTRLALVVDVGGGTTDLTLIRVEPRDSGPRLTRIAVGDHLVLGGDNMDLAIARAAEARVSGSAQLGTARFAQLVREARLAKERLLAADAPESTRITVLGSGGKLIGGARSTEVTRAEVESLVVDGFFPSTAPTERPERRRGAFVELGLPYVADPAITRHIAQFLAQNDELVREALGDAINAGPLAVPNAVLFNGGVFRGAKLAERLRAVLGSWRGAAPRVLENTSPELAVARGAVAYGLARRGIGLRIGGGSARSYFLVIDAKEGGRKGVCVLPRGAEEGEEIPLERRTFRLTLGKPVRFPLVASAQDVRHHRPGDLVDLDRSETAPDAGAHDAAPLVGHHDLPLMAAVLEPRGGASAGEIPVRLITALTEVGTLEMSCVAAEDPAARWKLELALRGASAERVAAEKVTVLHARFRDATALVHRIYGKSAEDVKPGEIKQLRAQLEKVIGARESWDTPLLRELFGALLAGAKRRRRTADHERVWFNLAGWALRPGFGYPLDDWRVRELFALFEQGVQFAPEPQNWAEWWILWRRVAGGLAPSMQEKLLDEVDWYLEPPSKRPRERPGGPKKLGYDDMVRLAGALEDVPAARKVRVGDFLVTRLLEHAENAQSWWAVGRLGARVPFRGSVHHVAPRDAAARWLEACLRVPWKAADHAPFAAALLARASGDRERDLPDGARADVAARLSAAGAPDAWQRMVREVTHLDAADERRVFGESLPPGLRLVD